MKKSIIFLFLVFLSYSPGLAGLYLEPSIGYGIGNLELPFIPLESGGANPLGAELVNKSDVNGILFGTKVGYIQKGIILALDTNILISEFDPKLDDPAITPRSSDPSNKAKATSMSIWLVGGYRVPVVPLTLWLGYSPFSDYALKFDVDDSDQRLRGYGYKIALGYRPSIAFVNLPININLEYVIQTYTKMDVDGDMSNYPVIRGTSPNISKYTEDTINTINLTVSVPISF